MYPSPPSFEDRALQLRFGACRSSACALHGPTDDVQRLFLGWSKLPSIKIASVGLCNEPVGPDAASKSKQAPTDNRKRKVRGLLWTAGFAFDMLATYMTLRTDRGQRQTKNSRRSDACRKGVGRLAREMWLEVEEEEVGPVAAGER